MNDEPDFAFLIPDVEARPSDSSKEADVGRLRELVKRSKEVGLTRQQVADFWRDKVVGLTETLAEAQSEHETKGFEVDEISFSIGVGAKGGVVFVAEGSIQATLSCTLRRS